MEEGVLAPDLYRLSLTPPPLTPLHKGEQGGGRMRLCFMARGMRTYKALSTYALFNSASRFLGKERSKRAPGKEDVCSNMASPAVPNKRPLA